MNMQDVTALSLDSFWEHSAGKKLVLLYPWDNYRRAFLTHFLSDTTTGLLYFRIPSEPTGWLEALVNEFDGAFGQNLRQALSTNNPKVLAEALADDLAAYQPKPVILFIDEFDRIALDTSFRDFLKTLIDVLPDSVQLTFSSRLLTYQPWSDLVASGQALVMGTERRNDQVLFTVDPTPKPQLEVYALGRGQVFVNGQPITTWDGVIPRNLFFYFMDNPLLTRDGIFAAFWPDLSVREATNVFHVTKHKIRELINTKIDQPCYDEFIHYSGGIYSPSDRIIRHYDVADFEEVMERALMTNTERQEEDLFMQAIELYKAPFLQTVNMAWAVQRRDQLRQLYAQALIGVGRIHQHREAPQRALGFFLKALKETPEREDIHREVMNLYLKLGMREEARMQYKRLQQLLHESLGIEPSWESKAVFAQLKSSLYRE